MPQLRRTGHQGMTEEARQRRRLSIGGSDARIIMSGNQAEIERLWHLKRGEREDDDLTDVLLVQMGVVLEPLVLDWFEFKTGLFITNEQERCAHPDIPWATCTLDGKVRENLEGPIIGIAEAKFMMPYGWNLDEAIEKYQPQFQWNAFVTGEDRIWAAIATGAAGFAQVEMEADPFYQVQLYRACEAFWDCVQSGKVPGNPVVEPPKVEAVKIVDMSMSNSFTELAMMLLANQGACDRYEEAKKGIKALLPADVKVASGHGVTLNRATNGRITIKLDPTAQKEAEEQARLRAEALA